MEERDRGTIHWDAKEGSISFTCISSQLSDAFWSMAASHAAYLLNRSPSTALKGCSPYEALHGDKPLMVQLRVFGEPVLVNVQGSTAARQGMWVGFDDRTNSHKVYMHDTCRLLVSAEATFLSNRWGSGVQLQWDDADASVNGSLVPLPPLVSASEANLLRKATGSLTPLSVSGLGFQEVMGDVKIFSVSASEPAPIELKNHLPIVNAKTLASDEFDGRRTLTYQDYR